MVKYFMDHIYIFITVLATVYSQLIIRWQTSLAGPLPDNTIDIITYIANLLMKPWVLSGLFSTFIAGIAWMLAMTKFEISYAFPFVSLNYIIIMAAGFFLFGETISTLKIVGGMVVIIGIYIIAKG
jgi:drug/metabolite transporter (DMT)-like permease